MKVPRYLRLLAKPRSLDFERAVHDLRTLVKAPWKTLEEVQSRRRTTGKWSRDDPAFPVLLSGMLIIAGVLWGLTQVGFAGTFRLIFYMFLIDYLAVGFAVSTLGFALCNRVLRQLDPNRLAPVEWSYFFDVHSNSFAFVYFYLYLLQFVLLPIIRRSNWFSVILGNLLYLAATIHYCVISLLGYWVISDKDLTIQKAWGAIIILSCFLFLALTFCKVSVAQVVLHAYFPTTSPNHHQYK